MMKGIKRHKERRPLGRLDPFSDSSEAGCPAIQHAITAVDAQRINIGRSTINRKLYHKEIKRKKQEG
ncbi:MAG: hypothetical protein ACLRTA_04955 [Clostridia bacterium]